MICGQKLKMTKTSFIHPQTQQYKNELRAIEKLMEASLLFLQSHIPVTSNDKNQDLKLKVTLHEFSGDYFKWITFRDLFDSMVIQNKHYGKAQQMQLLKTYVTGEAEKLDRGEGGRKFDKIA